MKKYEIKYEILQDFLLPLKDHQEEFNKIDFSQSTNETMQTTFGKSIKIEKITKFLNAYLKKYKLQILILWAQSYINGKHSAHVHTESDFSFVWYIKTDSNCSKINFYNPGWPYVETHKFTIQPNTGTFLLFNSVIPHEVLENKNQIRNVIAGNLAWLK